MKENISSIAIYGFDLLGKDNTDGIRYAWKYCHSKSLLESAAFSKRNKLSDDGICGYTTSVSSGCILHTFQQHCRFCRTGTLLPFSGFLSAFDIAKQNIFMALSDIYCNDHLNLKDNTREFAYMGQGEPGYSYCQVRLAIKLTDFVMKSIGQKVFRHIIATSGIPEMIEAYKFDVKHGFFDSRVTLHYSLHATQNRNIIMPIENIYPYGTVLKAMSDVVELIGEKPCLGIMLFNKFCPKEADWSYTNDSSTVRNILSEIDPSKFRLSFCEFNDINDISSSEPYIEHEGERLLELAREMGFEAKLFSSFGKEEVTACGLLAGQTPNNIASEKWNNIETETDKYLLLAMQKVLV